MTMRSTSARAARSRCPLQRRTFCACHQVRSRPKTERALAARICWLAASPQALHNAAAGLGLGLGLGLGPGLGPGPGLEREVGRFNVAARCVLQRAGRLLSLGLHRPHHVRRAVRRHLSMHDKQMACMHGICTANAWQTRGRRMAYAWQMHGSRSGPESRRTWRGLGLVPGPPSALINPQPLPAASPSAARSRPSSSTRALAATPRTRCTHTTARPGRGTAAPARQSSASRRPHARRGTCHGSRTLL